MRDSLENRISECYLSNIDMIAEGLPQAVSAGKSRYLEALNLIQLPSSKDEQYRHFPLDKYFPSRWEQYFTEGAAIKYGTARMIETEGYNIDIVNGFSQGAAGLCRLDNGVVYGSLNRAFREDPQMVSRYYDILAGRDAGYMELLNGLFMQDGAYIYIPEGVECDIPFIISCNFDTNEQNAVSYPRILVVAGDNSRCSIATTISSSGSNYFIDPVRELYAGDNADVTMIDIFNSGNNSVVHSSTYYTLGEAGKVKVVTAELGDGKTRQNYHASLDGRSASFDLYSLIFGTGNKVSDLNVNIMHNVPDCTSNQLAKAVASGNSVCSFTGKIYVAPDAQRTSAFQQSRNLQLSDTSRVFTEPQLEIYADDVKCSHGATVGQMDDDAVYYMRQRGLAENDARRLQMYGFINDILSKCSEPHVCGYLQRLAEKKLSQL